MISARSDSLQLIAREVRAEILKSIFVAQTGHAGSSLSLVDLLVFLYFERLRIDPVMPHCPTRDFVLLSKGHGAPALYATLAVRGFFPTEELATLRGFGSRLQGHPRHGTLPGVDFSTGSLGQGLSIGLGVAIGLKKQGRPNRIYCLMGDGELQEGQIWEAAMAAPRFGVGNLMAIVDRNGLQNDGRTEELIPLEDLVARFASFGWNALRANGHDFHAIRQAFLRADEHQDRPTVLIADTVKGKGVSFMEGVVKWHHHPLTRDEFDLAMSEVCPEP